MVRYFLLLLVFPLVFLLRTLKWRTRFGNQAKFMLWLQL